MEIKKRFGSPGRIRTAGQAVNSRLLYRWATGELFKSNQTVYTNASLLTQTLFFILFFQLEARAGIEPT